ncbi:hypothetical protein H2200_003719 [Cladophialophora chaetospira]|uniref:ABM domain-containing protein n=1 Tax=Cladophialophora chaetospira TaxID=386627 RepID=A0AA38XEW0_9EURO|nr:hypothetical protein H2200_003719 [Cladophialophora chaetospira]
MALKEPFYIVANLTPVPGKSQEVIAAIQPLTEYVQANEPGCLHYEMFQPAGPDVDAASAPVVFIELWKDMEALEIHRNSEPYKALMVRASTEGLLAAPPDVKVLQPVGGFPLRK